jgi:hypothetical protein
MHVSAEASSKRLLKAGTGSLIGALVAIVLCEAPWVAALLIGVGAGSAAGRIGGWLDASAVILLVASVALIVTGLLRRRRHRAD